MTGLFHIHHNRKNHMENKVHLTGILKKGYGINPKQIWITDYFNRHEKIVIQYLLSFTGNGNDSCFPSIVNMAKHLRSKEDKIRETIVLLEKKNMICVKRCSGKSHIYTINMNFEIPEEHTPPGGEVRRNADEIPHPGEGEGVIPCGGRRSPRRGGGVTPYGVTNNNTNNNSTTTRNNTDSPGCPPIVYDDAELFKELQHLFFTGHHEIHGEKILDHRKEWGQLKNIIRMVTAMTNDGAEKRDIIMSKMEIMRNMIENPTSPFWAGQSFLPSTLRSLFDRLKPERAVRARSKIDSTVKAIMEA